MRIVAYVGCVLLFASCSKMGMAYEARGAYKAEKAIVATEDAIDVCIREFEKRSGTTISTNIDQLNALVAPDKIDILFTKGETGDFGLRDRVIENFFSCGVLRENPLSLYFLLDIQRGFFFLVDLLDSYSQISDSQYTEPVWHLLFVKKDGRFHFSKIKEFDPVKFQNIQTK